MPQSANQSVRPSGACNRVHRMIIELSIFLPNLNEKMAAHNELVAV